MVSLSPLMAANRAKVAKLPSSRATLRGSITHVSWRARMGLFGREGLKQTRDMRSVQATIERARVNLDIQPCEFGCWKI